MESNHSLGEPEGKHSNSILLDIKSPLPGLFVLEACNEILPVLHNTSGRRPAGLPELRQGVRVPFRTHEAQSRRPEFPCHGIVLPGRLGSCDTFHRACLAGCCVSHQSASFRLALVRHPDHCGRLGLDRSRPPVFLNQDMKNSAHLQSRKDRKS